MAETGQDKTEEATPRRRSEARQDGNIPKSQDLTAAAMLLASILALHLVGLRVFNGMRGTMHTLLSGAHASNPTRADDLAAIGSYALRSTVTMLIPVTLIILAVGLVVTVGQVGFLITGKPLTPSFGKMNPAKGIKQMVNAKAAVRLLMSIGKVMLLTAIASWIMLSDLDKMLHIAELSVGPAFAVGARMVFEMGLALALVLVALALLDLWFQRWQHSKDLRMSKQEIKDEMKQMEGDPMVKQRRARVARQLALQRVSQAVPKADVVVTNPTHFAVALQYDSATMQAPKVVAKGADFMAMRIRQIAVANGVPLVERKPLARALYADIEVGQEVPSEHYAAVAEILAYVYRVSGQKVA